MEDATKGARMEACPSPSEAGAIWRSFEMERFLQQARAMGLETSPTFQAAWKELVERSESLDELAKEQESGERKRPWWADGEYDACTAARKAEEGHEHYARRRNEDALTSFTEAARLAPQCDVHHANRAAAAMRLRRWDVAAEAAEDALRIRPEGWKARMRAGEARKKLGDLKQAVQHFQVAVKMDPNHPRAMRGLEEATRALHQEEEDRSNERTGAQKGQRKGLELCLETDEEVAVLLQTAEDMCKAQPKLEAAKTAKVEALILCRRYEDAREALRGLTDGLDKMRLQVEIEWRSGGDVQDAWKELRGAPGAQASESCRLLIQDLERMAEARKQVDGAMDDERYQDAIELLTQAMQLDGNKKAAPLVYNADLLLKRAEAYCARGMRVEALQDLNQCLDFVPEHSEAVKFRAVLLEASGRYEDALADLFRLQDLDATSPGLLESMARLAAACEKGGLDGTAAPASMFAKDGLGESHCAVLELPPDATSAQVRRAYRKLAAQWHPDKWMTHTEDAKKVAEVRFREIQVAYEALLPQDGKIR
eukprot:CAMPEP_0183829350 /NCGR_PEP_ID=MMETSP0807_2-20130328/3258_1 /TAXON_ID=88271 /ORGANISM="Picocystis salinarum, Strain CCMP1897" /LENGTH=539 /DNA_ID=CAMNT_0026074557 /DNA_START=42 /DNA_END=1661 /DNA_ORIENTATION=+